MEEIPTHQWRLVVYPIIYKDLYIPRAAGFLPSTVLSIPMHLASIQEISRGHFWKSFVMRMRVDFKWKIAVALSHWHQLKLLSWKWRYHSIYPCWKRNQGLLLWSPWTKQNLAQQKNINARRKVSFISQSLVGDWRGILHGGIVGYITRWDLLEQQTAYLNHIDLAKDNIDNDHDDDNHNDHHLFHHLDSTSNNNSNSNSSNNNKNINIAQHNTT